MGHEERNFGIMTTEAIELRHLRYFVAAVEHGSFRKASVALRVQESAISRRILPARAYFGLTALRLERRSVRTADDTDTYRADRALVRSPHSRLNPYQRLLCMSLSLLRSAEVLVYNRSVHRRR